MHRIEGVEKLVWVLTGGVSENVKEPRYRGSCKDCGEDIGGIWSGPDCKA